MKTQFLTLILILVFSTSLFSKELKVGDKAPEFKATSVDGTTWDLSDHLGDKNIIVYFYPAAMTGGCTAQACSYRDMSDNIESANAMVVGISGDNLDGLKIFKEVHNLNFPLLSDESGKIAELFGVPTKDGKTINAEFEGKTYELTRGITDSRWTFIINKEGKIVYKNENVDPRKDSEQVLSFLQENK